MKFSNYRTWYWEMYIVSYIVAGIGVYCAYGVMNKGLDVVSKAMSDINVFIAAIGFGALVYVVSSLITKLVKVRENKGNRPPYQGGNQNQPR